MKSCVICMFCLFFMPAAAYSQDWQGLILVDSRTGYSTNTVLNPFYGSWDRSTSSGYAYVSSMGQLRKLGDHFSSDITAGGVYEPFFDEKEPLRGGFGLLNLKYRFDSDFSAGIEAGGSTFTSAVNRQTGWIQPMAAWSPTLFSQIRLKAGSTFRSPAEDGEQNSQRYDQFGIEFEIWLSLGYQLNRLRQGIAA